MKDSLEQEIAGEIEKISLDIKNILKRIEGFGPPEKEPPEAAENKLGDEKPGP